MNFQVGDLLKYTNANSNPKSFYCILIEYSVLQHVGKICMINPPSEFATPNGTLEINFFAAEEKGSTYEKVA